MCRSCFCPADAGRSRLFSRASERHPDLAFPQRRVLLRMPQQMSRGIGKDAVTVVFLVGVMFYQDSLLALVWFFVFPAAIRPIVAIGRRIRRVTANAQAEIGQFTTLLSQTLQVPGTSRPTAWKNMKSAAPPG